MDFNISGLPVNKTLEKKQVKLLVIGSGPAGFSAALYAARAELNPVLLNRDGTWWAGLIDLYC